MHVGTCWFKPKGKFPVDVCHHLKLKTNLLEFLPFHKPPSPRKGCKKQGRFAVSPEEQQTQALIDPGKTNTTLKDTTLKKLFKVFIPTLAKPSILHSIMTSNFFKL